MKGKVFINKVPGNFHISGHHYPDAMMSLIYQKKKIDFTHKINWLSFGDKDAYPILKKEFGQTFSLDLNGKGKREKDFREFDIHILTEEEVKAGKK